MIKLNSALFQLENFMKQNLINTCIVGNSPGCPMNILNPFPFPSTLPKLTKRFTVTRLKSKLF